MNNLRLIESALEATAIEGPAGFCWFGKRPPALAPRIRKSLSPGTAREYLLSTLQECLYSNFYCMGFASPAEWQGGPAGMGAADLSEELSRANAGAGRWDDGWKVCAAENAHLRVEKSGFVLTISTDDFRPDPPRVAVAGSSGSVNLPKELYGISPEFYMALGDLSEPAAPHRTLRLYWNVTPRGAVQLMQALTSRLNAAAVPFRFKVLKSAAPSGRCDVGVLYVPREHSEPTLAIAAEIHDELANESLLRPLTPVFTKRLAPGLGLAEQPDPETSFGTHRCGLMAEALLSAHERGRRLLPERRRAVVEGFEHAGLGIGALYLNPGSSDSYAFPMRTRAALSAPSGPPERSAPDPTVFLQAAESLGRRLAHEAVWHEDRCTWIGAFPSEEATTSRSLGPELYSGTAGVALFLGELASVTGETALARTARAALRQSFHTIDAVRPSERLGLFTGWSGIGYAATRMGRALNDEALVQSARALLGRLKLERPGDGSVDLMAGSAGAILALVELGDEGTEGWIKLASRLAEDLLDRAVAEGETYSWRSFNHAHEYNLTGLSHGAAGIGLALTELWAVTGEVRYQDAARRAFAYEERWFDERAGNWPDLRGVRARRARPRQLPFSTFWCHGAAGIALARLRAFERLGDLRYLQEGRRGLDTVREWLAQMLRAGAANFSLCHGLAGNAEVLRIGAEVDSGERDADLRVVAEVAQAGIEHHLETGAIEDWPCAVGGGPAPSLMLGLAGIGHFYLRLYKPAIEPILLLGGLHKTEGGPRCQA